MADNNNNTKDNNSSKDIASDDSNYVHVDGGLISKDSTRNGLSNDNSVEVDSVVDSNESIDDSQQVATNSSSTASFNDLDIPTPDYETDENIYAIEDSNYREFSSNETNNTRRIISNSNTSGKNLSSKSNAKRNNNKEDLYYSGFLAHIPQNHYGQTTGAGLRSASSIGVGIGGGGGGGGKSSQYLDCSGSAIVDNTKTMSSSSYNTREKSRFFMHKNGRMLNSNKQSSGRDMIYGSTTGLPSMAGSRYRSTSMQRYYPRSNHLQQQHQYHQVDLITKQQQQLGNELYDPDHDLEDDPYTMSGSVVDVQGHYGIAGHRRRLGGKLNGIPYGGVNGGGNNINSNNGLALHRVSSSMANSNYDIGRSSSGIYGNNSSSSSSDYADWHPQMRKVNSSGYLNSIFKNHISSPVDPFNNHHSNVWNFITMGRWY